MLGSNERHSMQIHVYIGRRNRWAGSGKEERMRVARCIRGRRKTVLIAIAVLTSLGAFANPGLLPPVDTDLASIDFSPLPGTHPTEHNIGSWQTSGSADGSRCLQLVRAGASLEIVIHVPSNISASRLTLVHRTSPAQGGPGGGFAPVTISVNGTVLAASFSPEANAWGYSTDRWEIAGRLVPGTNRIRIVAEELCSVYEIQRLEIGSATGTSTAIEESQMTHAIANNRPTDLASWFATTDARAFCWTRVAEERIGRPIEWRFYDPSGSLYFKAARTADRYSWGYINIAGENAADRPGPWRVDIYVNGEFQQSHAFTIGSTGVGSRPFITGIDFPDEIRSNGQRVSGYVSFYDPDGDIRRITFEAVDCFFSDFEFDPNVAGQTSGRFEFYIYTYLTQDVRLKVILHDRLGNESPPGYLTFRAS